jgi:hypothetical protein
MSTQVNLKADVVELAQDSLRIGANPSPANQFSISITNRGEEIISEERIPPNLYLKGRLGGDAAALFLKKEDATQQCTITKPATWHCDWDFADDESFCLKIYSDEEKLFEKGGAIKITLSNVISKTAPGKAILSFASDLSQATQTLDISKEAKSPDIIYFISEPMEGVQNLPGDSVTLKWRTYNLTDRTLNQTGISDPLSADFTTSEGAKNIARVTADTSFCLKGYDGPKAIERTLTVKVLRSGWYARTISLLEGDPGYPSPENKEQARAPKPKEYDLEPTLLLNANDTKLYGVFRFFAQDRERAYLFETTNPFGPWKFVNASVPAQRGCIPEGFSTSPGAYFDEKLWLVGGSQIDPENCSNETWCFDHKQGRWENWGAAPWSARMGHAVLLCQNKIWVMGGREEGGQVLNDVWAFDVKSKTWSSLGQAPWAPRCLFNPAVFDEQLWLYGGAQEPFSNDLYDDVFTYKDGVWSKVNITGIIAGSASRKPIASCLQVFNNKLCLFGKFRTVDPTDKSEKIEPLAFSLSTPSTKTWDSFSNDGLKNWGGDTTFSYQLLNFKNVMLIAKALSYETTNLVMKIYVP